MRTRAQQKKTTDRRSPTSTRAACKRRPGALPESSGASPRKPSRRQALALNLSRLIPVPHEVLPRFRQESHKGSLRVVRPLFQAMMFFLERIVQIIGQKREQGEEPSDEDRDAEFLYQQMLTVGDGRCPAVGDLERLGRTWITTVVVTTEDTGREVHRDWPRSESDWWAWLAWLTYKQARGERATVFYNDWPVSLCFSRCRNTDEDSGERCQCIEFYGEESGQGQRQGWFCHKHSQEGSARERHPRSYPDKRKAAKSRR